MVFLPIPNFERYLISQNGTVVDTVEEEVIQTKSSLAVNTKVKLLIKNRKNRYRLISVARLILITHKPIKNVDLGTLWSPKLINEDQRRISADNLEYDFGDYFPPSALNQKEFHHVPTEHRNMMINLAGEVLVSGKKLDIKQIKGYNVVSLTNPNGTTRYIGVYRLLAITFLRRPIDYSDLIVNHKDGNSLNDDLENLEWTTYRGNMIHAHENKLVQTSFPIEVLNISSGEIRNFFSIGEFSRFHNLNQRETKRLEFRMRMFTVVANYRGFSIRSKQFPVKWEGIERADRYRGNAKEVTIVDEQTGKVFEFLWFKDASDFLEVSQYKLREALRKFGKIRIGNYSVSYFLPNIAAGNTAVSES